MKRIMAVMLSMALTSSVIAAQAQENAASTTTPSSPRKKIVRKTGPTVSEQLDQLKKAIESQQEQIKQLSDQVQSRDQRIQQLEQRLDQSQAVAVQAQTKADTVATQTAEQQQTVVALKSDVTTLQTTTNNTAMTLQETLKETKNVSSEWESPMSIHLKGVTITPGGFAAAEFVRRSRELGADIITPFNNLTMPGASQSQLPEFFGTARQSRPTVFVGGRLANVELSSYVSGDFLSSGTTSNNNQTNSYTFRLRQAWGQAKFNNGWKILGGQMWSLVTEMKAGIAPSDDAGHGNDARPTTIDGQYNVGFTFARQYGLRLTKDFGDKFSAAFAIENAQGTLTTHGNVDNYLLGEAGATNEANAFNGTYTANPAPDLIAKIAFDPGFGHYEIFGLADRFADRIFPCVAGGPASTSAFCPPAAGASTTAGAYNASKEGGGFGANARWTFANKHVVFGLHGFGGSGIGRYGAAGLSDLSINPDGSVHLIKGLQGLGTLEYHGKKLDIYSYVGAEYASRTYSFYTNPSTSKTVFVGYGSPTFANYGCYTETAPGTGNTYTTGFNPGALADCTSDTRADIEGTIGFWYRFYNGPKGRMQFGTQYSYVTRQTWSGATAAPTGGSPTFGALSPEGLDGMVFTSFRYYLP